MSTLLDRLARNARAQLHDLLRRYGMAEPSPEWRDEPQADPVYDEPPDRSSPLPHSAELAEAFRVLDLPFGAPLPKASERWKSYLKRCHPDRFHNDPKRQTDAAELTRQLNTAHDRIESGVAARRQGRVGLKGKTMPTVAPEEIERIGTGILRAAGASDEEARIIMEHLVGANLAGHDSHGIILLPTYIARIKRSHIVPGAAMEVERETSSSARINGNWGFGYVVTTRAMEMAIAKARERQVAAITIYQQSHVGRLADYPLMAARAGMIGLITCDSGRGPKAVAPYGGREARLGTNPLSVAFPSDLEGPVFLDMATSAVAGGKLAVRRSRGEAAPPGWVIDKHGEPTTDLGVYYDGGAILPMGGDQAHKGYVLSFMVETLSGLLTGLGFGIDPQGRHNDGTFLAVFNVEAFRPLAEFKRDIADFVAYLKATPPAAGFTEVLYPGELEFRTSRQRCRDGIYVEDATWNLLGELQREYGLDG